MRRHRRAIAVGYVAIAGLPDDRGVAALAELEVDLVAIHAAAPAASRRALTAYFEAAPWATVHRLGEERLLRIDPGSIPACSRRAGRPPAAGGP